MINLRTRNFSIKEVIHRLKDFPEELLPTAFSVMGYLQAFRDGASAHFGKDVPIIILSGYRSPEYNTEIEGSNNSYHIWRQRDHQLVFAVDIISPEVALEDLFAFAKTFVVGEVYMHKSKRLLHIAPYGNDEEFVME